MKFNKANLNSNLGLYDIDRPVSIGLEGEQYKTAGPAIEILPYVKFHIYDVINMSIAKDCYLVFAIKCKLAKYYF